MQMISFISLERKFQHPRSSSLYWINLLASVSASHVFLKVVDLQSLSFVRGGAKSVMQGGNAAEALLTAPQHEH